MLIIAFLTLEIASLIIAPQVDCFIKGLSDDGRYLYNIQTATLHSNLRLNERGEYSSELFSYDDPGPDVLRVLQLGSSMTTFSAGHLGEELKKKFSRVEFIDCSVPGSNILNSFYLYAKRCSLYKGVDYVILQTTLSIEGSSHYLFVGPGEVQQSTIGELLFLANQVDFLSTIKRPRSTLDEYGFRVLNYDPKVIAEVRRLSKPRFPFYRWSNLVRMLENATIASRVSHKKTPASQVWNKIPRSMTIIRKLSEQVSENGSRFLVANIPSQTYLAQYRLEKKLPDAVVGKTGILVPIIRDVKKDKEYYLHLTRAFSKLNQELKSSGIEVIDLTQALGNYNSGTLYGPDHYHLGPLGLDVVYGVIAKKIEQDLNN